MTPKNGKLAALEQMLAKAPTPEAEAPVAPPAEGVCVTCGAPCPECNPPV